MKNYKCLKCKERMARASRGLCRPCYSVLRLRVKRGEASWEALIAEGVATAGVPLPGRSWSRDEGQRIAEVRGRGYE